ncbi:MAG: tRNA (N(6)-L-threonylcarbamoyladenosine(37)-C(2))-methylthiotransferase MtaB [bacterium]
MKIALTTVGCKLNQYETSAMSELLRENGFEIAPFFSCADFYVVNSCSVTKKAELDTRKFIKKAKRINPRAKIIITGCCASLIDPLSVDLILNNKQKTKIADYVYKLQKDAPSKTFSGKENTVFFPSFKTFFEHSRAFIKIQDGCDVSCSYCIVPQVRGKSQSQKEDEILEQAKIFINRGYKEIVISGVNIGAYGRDFFPETNLAGLLKKLIAIPGLGRIRLSSIEPQEFDKELLDIIKDPRICPHLHLPLQSGDDKILEAMRRKYRVRYYLCLIDALFEKVPDLNLGTDIIAGFPGEGDKEFNNTFELVKKIPFAYLHIFRYSQRPGTIAESFDNQVAEKIKKERAMRLAVLNKEKKDLYAGKFLNKTLQAFIENRRDNKTKRCIGLSDNYLRLYINGPEEIKNQIVTVRITGTGDKIFAEVC